MTVSAATDIDLLNNTVRYGAVTGINLGSHVFWQWCGDEQRCGHYAPGMAEGQLRGTERVRIVGNTVRDCACGIYLCTDNYARESNTPRDNPTNPRPANP